MRLIKTKNKQKYKWNDVLIYRLQQILFYLGLIIPFPFIMIYAMVVDLNYAEPFYQKYKYTVEKVEDDSIIKFFYLITYVYIFTLN